MSATYFAHPESSSPWWGEEEAAAYLNIKVRRLQNLARTGEIKAYRVSGTIRHRYRFRKENLDRWLIENR